MDQLFLREQDSQPWPSGIWKHASHWYFFCFHPLLLKLYVVCLANVFPKYFPFFFLLLWSQSSLLVRILLLSPLFASITMEKSWQLLQQMGWFTCLVSFYHHHQITCFFLFLFLDLASYHHKFLDWFRCSIFWYWYFVLKIIIHPVIVDPLSSCISLTPTQCFKQALDVRQAVRLRLAPKAFLGGSTFFTQME